MSVVGTSTEWADLIDPMVPEILDLVTASWEEIPLPTPDEKEDDYHDRVVSSPKAKPYRPQSDVSDRHAAGRAGTFTGAGSWQAGHLLPASYPPRGHLLLFGK